MMESRPFPAHPAARTEVRVTLERGEESRATHPPLIVLGVASPDAPWLGERWPRARVRSTRFGSRRGAVELLTLGVGDALDTLPGLDTRAPSLVRDAVRLCLHGGAPRVGLLLARGETLDHPWDLDRPELLELCAPFLDDLHGALLVMPDAAGPAPLRPGPPADPEERARRLARVIAAHAPGLCERYQVALLDWPAELSPDARALLPMSGDLSLVAWQGDPSAMAAHGWRSGAALLGGALAAREPFESVTGLRLPLGAGRRVAPDRAFGLEDPRPTPAEQVEGLALLRARGGLATVLSEPSRRRPAGAWPLPALRTVKAVHHTLVRAAEKFAFSRVGEAEALSLGLSLNMALGAFVSAGLLVGPDGEGGPLIESEPVRDPAAPALAATLTAQLRPWCSAVHVRVRVRDGAQPTLEEA